MQPYFFPYAQQLRHIAQCDRWIVFDTPKFSRKSYVTRNRILNKQSGWSYINVPVAKGASRGSIKDAGLGSVGWRADLLDALRIYEHSAPYYRVTIEFVQTCIADDHETIADLNTFCLSSLCVLLNIDTRIDVLSQMPVELPDAMAPGEWACHISKEIGARIYSNAPGGRSLFDPEVYRRAGIELEFYEPCELLYETPGFEFVPDLSVIDTLMWIGPGALGEWCKT